MNRGRRRLTPIPDPPPVNASILTLTETAGYLRLRLRTVHDLRQKNPAFARLVSVIGGVPRVRRAALDLWIAAQPTGWSAMGGRHQQKGAAA